jgi:hypothetical protein
MNSHRYPLILCLHALEQLIVHSQPTHAVAVFDDEDRAHGWRHQRLPSTQGEPCTAWMRRIRFNASTINR